MITKANASLINSNIDSESPTSQSLHYAGYSISPLPSTTAITTSGMLGVPGVDKEGGIFKTTSTNSMFITNAINLIPDELELNKPSSFISDNHETSPPTRKRSRTDYSDDDASSSSSFVEQDNKSNSNRNIEHEDDDEDDDDISSQFCFSSGVKKNGYSAPSSKKCQRDHATRWTIEEDLTLVSNQSKIGNKWLQISHLLPGRSKTECHVRFISIQRAAKKEWTPGEDKLLLELSDRFNSDFYGIRKYIPGRTINAIKTRLRDLNKVKKGLAKIEPPPLGSSRQIFSHDKTLLLKFFPLNSQSFYSIPIPPSNELVLSSSVQLLQRTASDPSVLSKSSAISSASMFPTLASSPTRQDRIHDAPTPSNNPSSMAFSFQSQQQQKQQIQPTQSQQPQQNLTSEKNQSRGVVSAPLPRPLITETSFPAYNQFQPFQNHFAFASNSRTSHFQTRNETNNQLSLSQLRYPPNEFRTVASSSILQSVDNGIVIANDLDSQFKVDQMNNEDILPFEEQEFIRMLLN